MAHTGAPLWGEAEVVLPWLPSGAEAEWDEGVAWLEGGDEAEDARLWISNVGSGAATGAATGSAAGPWDALIGGLVGAGLGALQTALTPQPAPQRPAPTPPPPPRHQPTTPPSSAAPPRQPPPSSGTAPGGDIGPLVQQLVPLLSQLLAALGPTRSGEELDATMEELDATMLEWGIGESVDPSMIEADGWGEDVDPHLESILAEQADEVDDMEGALESELQGPAAAEGQSLAEDWASEVETEDLVGQEEAEDLVTEESVGDGEDTTSERHAPEGLTPEVVVGVETAWVDEALADVDVPAEVALTWQP